MDAQSQQPGSGLYGPDGRFVESAAGRDLAPQTTDGRARDLALSQIEAIIPPAAREELRALADRVDRTVNGHTADSRQLKQIAELMDKVGRYDEARRALASAAKLEQSADPQPEKSSPAVLDEARPQTETSTAAE